MTTMNNAQLNVAFQAVQAQLQALQNAAPAVPAAAAATVDDIDILKGNLAEMAQERVHANETADCMAALEDATSDLSAQNDEALRADNAGLKIPAPMPWRRTPAWKRATASGWAGPTRMSTGTTGTRGARISKGVDAVESLAFRLFVPPFVFV